MKFQKQTITIKHVLGTSQLSAMLAVGTGLAYHHVFMSEGVNSEEYAITHVPSGRSIFLPIKTEEQAKALLMAVVVLDIDAWNVPLDMIQKIVELCHEL